MRDTIEVLLIEDHPIVRDACRSSLARRPDLASLEASSARDGLALNRHARLPPLVTVHAEPHIERRRAQIARRDESVCRGTP